MSTRIKYAYRKEQTWLYRRNYPKHLQPVLGGALKRSLATGDARVARARVTELNAAFLKIVEEAETTQHGHRNATGQLPVTFPRLQRLRIQGDRMVADLATLYLRERAGELCSGSFKSVRYSLGLFASMVGQRKIGSLSRSDGLAFLSQIARLDPDVGKSCTAKGASLKTLVRLSDGTGQTIATQTQARIWKQVCQFLDWSVREGHISSHPLGNLEVAGTQQVASYAVLSDAEVATLLRDRDPMLSPILRLCLLSGLRSGEACGLLAEDLVSQGNLGTFIQVRQNQLRTLKSKSAERVVPVHDGLLPLLQELPSSGPLFPHLSVDKVTKRFAILRRRLALERSGLVFHSTRKWFITQCERAGVPEHFTASLVGHQAARSANRLTYGLYSAGISNQQKRQIIDQIKLPAGL